MSEEISVRAEIINRGDGSYILRPKAPVQWVRTEEAARITGMSKRTVQRWIVAKRIVARRVGPRVWQVDLASLEKSA